MSLPTPESIVVNGDAHAVDGGPLVVAVVIQKHSEWILRIGEDKQFSQPILQRRCSSEKLQQLATIPVTSNPYRGRKKAKKSQLKSMENCEENRGEIAVCPSSSSSISDL
ncbi:hypothetical protein TIFTF001_020626 [Ficus carica]|uniref:Uncharacterized protein n=1 Tax=Ficus carica TaxID=3494 RepID=A0AA88AIS9_FICCA|nr:hypothetical protein TIFTF001_020626 [Ficus carica]